MRAAFDMPIDQILKGVKINLAVFKRGDERDDRTFKHSFSPVLVPTLPLLPFIGKRISAAFIAVFVLLAASMPAQAAESDWAHALGGNDALSRKLFFWFKATDTDQPLSLQEEMNFISSSPDWPKLYMLRNRVEKGIEASRMPAGEVAGWFDGNAPRQSLGLQAYLDALLDLDRRENAKAALRAFWIDSSLLKSETQRLSSNYSRLYSLTDHIDRLDNLLWERRYDEAQAMLPLVDAEHRALAKARISLGKLSSEALKILSQVPITLQNDEGLLLDRLRWQRSRNQDSYRFQVLYDIAGRALTHPDEWWKERHIIARRAIENDDYKTAYKIASAHGMTQGPDYAQAEWLAGWLALRFLHDPAKAYQHFDKMYNNVTSAVSRSRATYWLARASHTGKQKEAAQNWLKLSASFPSTFYGQLSHEATAGHPSPSQFSDDLVPAERKQAFDRLEIVRVIKLLSRNGLQRYIDPFFTKLLEKAQDRVDYILIAKLARASNRPYYAVEANKQMQQKIGEFMFTEGYPLLPSLPVQEPEAALVHAIVHRESMFDPEAESAAGARGLMQLMPATAKQVSNKLGKPFAVNRLKSSPQYNVQLGSAYLQGLLNRYDGFYPLAIAAYNAGPGNVSKWIKEFGDPRDPKADIVDWIEKIPIYETRNYVQRVMESYYIYRLRLGVEPITVLGSK